MQICEDTFICLKDFSEASTELTLVHAGKESCRPYHGVSDVRDEYILHFVLSGKGVYSANGSTWSVDSGHMFLICPNEPVIYCADTDSPWSYLWIGFKGIRADTILKNCGFSKNQLVLPAPACDEYADCFDDLFRHGASDFPDSLFRESILLKLFAILADHHSRHASDSAYRQTGYSGNTYINRSVDYISKMYKNGIGVSDIADSVGLSRAHLNQLFQKELHISIQDFLINFRMQRSASLLISTEMSVKEISILVGYKDQLVFSRAFKRKFGMSPKIYRANARQENPADVNH